MGAHVSTCAGGYHGFNVKLTRVSGLRPALGVRLEEGKFGFNIMMGSMNESSIGSAAIAHFLPQLDYVDMDGPLLLTHDLASGINFTKGKIEISQQAGLGITVLSPTPFRLLEGYFP